jgi:hypothetical protein
MDQLAGLSIDAPALRVGAKVKVDRAAIYLVCLATLAIYFLIWPIWRAQFPLEIWLTEGWNAYLQDAAAAGLHLYPSSDSLVGNNYPPLSFYVVGWLGKILGDSLYVGRALSIVGLLCVAGEIFLCVRILTGGITGSAIGALWYVAIMSHNSAVYVGANDPQLAGEAIMGAALVWFLARDKARLSPTPALLLMVVGGFWKHNMIAIPLTAIIWLLARDRSKAIGPTLTSVAAVLAGLLLCGLLFGADFFADLLAPRAYGWGNILANIGHLQWCGLAFVIWATWALSDRRSSPARFTLLHVATGLGACVLQWSGEGVSGNAEFDLLLALGIAVGVTFSRMETAWLTRYIRANYLRDMMMVMLLVRLIATGRHESALVMLSPEFRSYFYSGQQAVLKDAAAVAQIPGNVFCSNKIICRLAGKPFAVDDFKVEQMVATERVTSDFLAETLKHRFIVAFTNDPMTRASPRTSLSKIWW